MRVIAITGAPGVGKTEAGRLVVTYCPPRSVVLDTDALIGIHPFVIDAHFHQLAGKSLRGCIENLRAANTPILVLTGVLRTNGLLPELAPQMHDPSDRWSFYHLRAAPEVLKHRILRDPKTQDAAGRLQWVHLNDENVPLPNAHILDTTNLNLEQVAETIVVREGLAAPPPREPETVSLPSDHVISTCERLFEAYHTPHDVARRLVRALVRNDVEGHASHGLLQVPGYVEAIGQGIVWPDGRPVIRRESPVSCTVDGQRGFGILAAESIRRCLVEMLAQQPIAVVGLCNSFHVGRLEPIVRGPAEKGYVVVGCANYLGGGQKVAPPGGREARLATNPIVAGLPLEPGAAIVFDAATSATSEGHVREALLRGKPVPLGWLVDADWSPVRNPGDLYTDPPRAHLAPLGGPAGYKGFGLALVVEVLAGILTGAGFVGPHAPPGGNGGLFIGMRPDVLGRSLDSVRREVERLVNYVEQCPVAPGHASVRVPGKKQPGMNAFPTSIPVISRVWETITALARQKRMRRRVPAPRPAGARI